MGWQRRPASGQPFEYLRRAMGSVVRIGVCLLAGVSGAAAGTIGLHARDLDIVDLYAGEMVVEVRADTPGAPIPPLAGLKFSAIDVINPGLDPTAVAQQAQEQIKEWTGAQTGPFDTNVTLAALVRGSTAVPGEAAPQAGSLPLAPETGSSVAPARGPLASEALASAMPTTLAGVVSPSLFTQTATPQPSASAPPPSPGPALAPAPEAATEAPPSRSGPSLLTIAAIAALVVIGATTFATQSDRSNRPRRRRYVQRDF